MLSTVELLGTTAQTRVGQIINDLRALAIRALRRMYRPDEQLFAFRLRRQESGVVLEGVSPRYTAVVLLALAEEKREVGEEALCGHRPCDVCDRLVERIGGTDDLGAVALTLWAARVLEHPRAPEVLGQLRAMGADERAYPTVELAWSLMAQVAADHEVADLDLARRIADRLVSSFQARSWLFPHWPNGSSSSRLRAPVACYADLAYPIQALSRYAAVTGSPSALDAARCCADRMCERQGPEGQWWWHYDVRTGQVIERFPVYAVHQDAMGPMALFALEDACEGDYADPIARSILWLTDAPELRGSLIDHEADLIWRKVGRHEPGKLTRSLQAAASRVHPSLRAPVIDMLFRPGRVDYETRPYHMGWILYAFSGDKADRLRMA
jgi:hypothetical protein